MSEDIAREASRIVREVERIAGVPSRWDGRIEYEDELSPLGNPLFLARKDWSCGITVHRALLDDPRLKLSLVHEAFHSVSVGVSFATFQTYPGYEEGVVEWLTRRYGPMLARGAAGGTGRTAFEHFLRHLEALRGEAGMETPTFYHDLLRTPLRQRETTVIEWVKGAHPGTGLPRVLASVAQHTRGLRGA